jgi:hypothetical protein
MKERKSGRKTMMIKKKKKKRRKIGSNLSAWRFFSAFVCSRLKY